MRFSHLSNAADPGPRLAAVIGDGALFLDEVMARPPRDLQELIERGEDGEKSLSDSEAIETLLSNSDDAYGFPPYSVIKKRLTQYYGPTLEQAERDIVTHALSGLPANLVRSSSMNWAQRIPELAGVTSEPRVSHTAAASASLAPAT